MPVTRLSTPFAAIFSAIVQQTANALGISNKFVRPVASDDYDVTETEDLFAYLRPFSPYPCDSNGNPLTDGGAGKLGRLTARRFRIYIWTRSGTDTFGGDENALMGSDVNMTIDTPITDPPALLGQFYAEEVVLNALDDFQPVSPAGAAITTGPIHWLPSEGGPPLRKAKNEEGLVWNALDFQAVYVISQVPNEPAPAIPLPANA